MDSIVGQVGIALTNFDLYESLKSNEGFYDPSVIRLRDILINAELSSGQDEEIKKLVTILRYAKSNLDDTIALINSKREELLRETERLSDSLVEELTTSPEMANQDEHLPEPVNCSEDEYLPGHTVPYYFDEGYESSSEEEDYEPLSEGEEESDFELPSTPEEMEIHRERFKDLIPENSSPKAYVNRFRNGFFDGHFVVNGNIVGIKVTDHLVRKVFNIRADGNIPNKKRSNLAIRLNNAFTVSSKGKSIFKARRGSYAKGNFSMKFRVLK